MIKFKGFFCQSNAISIAFFLFSLPLLSSSSSSSSLLKLPIVYKRVCFVNEVNNTNTFLFTFFTKPRKLGSLRNRACRYASLVNANFSVNQMCPIICRWKLVKHRYCFGDNRRTKDNRKIKLSGLKACCVT